MLRVNRTQIPFSFENSALFVDTPLFVCDLKQKKKRNKREKHVLRTKFSSANAGKSLNRCESDKYVARSSRTANTFVKQINFVQEGRRCS